MPRTRVVIVLSPRVSNCIVCSYVVVDCTGSLLDSSWDKNPVSGDNSEKKLRLSVVLLRSVIKLILGLKKVFFVFVTSEPLGNIGENRWRESMCEEVCSTQNTLGKLNTTTRFCLY
eukprot:TRINITY_DN952_c0_g5_i1.p2 TRINITY_DN952_c0_g5~~TRINITY_DN952_c0_g5_i1.p2  ORF type:complete len:116 (+),score=6.94 TRINITY_DN952_c0_g5_i1:1493-1840(+)